MKKQLLLLLFALLISVQANSQAGAALNFDGVNDYVAVGTIIPINSSYTKEAWIYANAAGSNNIISSGSSPFWLNSNRLSAQNNGGTVLQDPAVFPLTQWVHVAVTYNAATSLLSLYKNGTLVISGVSASGYPADLIRIGDYPTVAGNGFNGSIDEVRIWNVARTQCEINSYMSCEIPTTSTGLLANYHFNQGVASGSNPGVTSLIDASGNTNTGTLTNFALTGATSNWIAPGGVVTGFSTPTACTQAAALNFDGINDRVSVPNNASLNFGTGDFTVESYFKSAVAQPNYAGIVVKATGGGNTGFQLVVVGNKLAAEFSDGVTALGVGNGLSGTTTLTDGIWHHLAMIVTRAQNKIELLVDGNIEATVINGSISTMNINAAVPLFIGTERTNTAFMNGNLDEVRLWNVARTKCQINTFKNCEIASTAPGLVANYHYNQGTASGSNGAETNLADFSGNINTGTLINFALTGATSNWIAPGSVISGSTTPLAPPTIAVNSGSIIGGSSFTMSPSGGVSYTYLPSGPIVTPVISASYTVTGTSAGGCTNTAISSVSVQGGALNFDGADDFVQNASAPNMPLMNAFTIESWVNLNNTVNGKIFSSNEMEFAVISGGQLQFYCPAFSGNTTGTVTVATGIWQHVAATYNGSKLSFYINGALSGTFSATGAIAANTGYKIGKHVSANCCLISGSMDELKIWNRALCLTEIQNNMNSELPAGQTGLVLYHKMNQGFAAVANPGVTTLTDASGNGNNGTLTNFALSGATSNWVAPGAVITGSLAPAFVSPVITASPSSTTICNSQSAVLTGGGALTYTWNGGVINATAFTPSATASYTVIGTTAAGCTNTAVATVNVNNCTPAAALNFDGSNDFIVVPDNSGLDFGSGNFTVEFWVNKQANSVGYSNTGGVGKWNTGASPGSNEWTLSLTKNGNDNLPNFGFESGTTGYNCPATTPLALNTWNHLAAVREGTAMKIYVNGILENTINIGNVAVNNVGRNVLIGAIQSGYFSNMKADEVRIWNVARSQCEINTFKNCEIASTATGLVANYHFNQGFNGVTNTVTALTDASGNSNTGTLTNFALTGATSNWIAPGGVNSGSVTPASLTPTVTASPSSTTICNSQSAVLTGGGASTYTWNGGVVNATAFTPTGTASYTVTGTSAVGCTNTAVATVNVNNCTPAAALNFDGVNDFVACGNAAALNLTGDLTIEAWVQRTTSGTDDCIIGKDQFGLNTGYSFWIFASNKFSLRFGNSAYASTSNISVGSFNHLAATYSAGTLRLYLNGVLDATFTGVTAPVSNTGGLFIGTPQDAVGNTAYALAASVDEVRIWNVARTQCEINTFKNCEIPTTASGLVVNYHFNQAFNGVTNTVTTLTDASGNSNTGTLTNFALTGATSNWIAPGGVISGSVTPASLTPIVTASPSNTTICNSQSAVLTGGGAVTYTWNGGVVNATAFTPTGTASYTVTGTSAVGCTNTAVATVNVNNCTPAAALNFDGVNDFVAIGNVIPTGSSYTKEMWVYANSNGCNNMLSSGDDPFYLSGGKLAAGNSGNYNYVQDANNFPLNAWTHAVVTYDAASATMNLYVNGVLVATGNSAPAYSGIPTMYIGRHTGGCYFDGTLDEIRIWNVARTQCEINTYMNCEIPSNATGLLANYHFNQGFDGVTNTVTTLTDASGNANTGTLSNFALTGATSNWIAPGGVISGSVTPASLIPMVTASVTNPVICNGASTTLNGGGADTYTWTSGVTDGVSFTPANTATYVVNGTNTLTGCTSTNSAVQVVTVNPLPVLSVNSGSICNGQSFTMVPSGASTYTFSNGSAVVTPTITSSYSVSGTSTAGCVSSAPAVSSVTVNALPVISVNSGVICNGQSFTMTPTGATTYTFSNGSAVVSPSGNASYSVTGTDGIGCVSSLAAVSNVTVNSLPIVTATISNTVICEGSTTTLNGGGADTYTWTGAVTNGVAFTPLTSGSYTVTGTNTLTGCSSTNSAVGSVTVNLLPAVTAAITNSVICEGSTTTLNGGGADTYTWTGAVTNGVAFTPTVTGTYSVTGTNTLTGCSSTNVAAASVTVNSNPVIGAASGAICNNGTFTIMPNGANTYTISGGSAVVSPSTTTSYSVTGTSTAGCTGNTAVVTVSVQSSLTVSIAGSNTVCDGSAVSLTANGAATYTWNNGAVSNTIAPTPTVNTTYSVTGSSGTCSNSAVISITVNSTPTVSAVSNTSLICSGQTVSLTASGAVTYTWNTNATGANITVTPTMSTTYTVTGADVNGCANSATVFQNVSVCTDIKSVNNSISQIEMYPNPTTGMVTVKLNSNAQIIIMNTVGQVIANEVMTEGKRDFDITHFANGIYFVKVISNGNQQTFKLIKE